MSDSAQDGVGVGDYRLLRAEIREIETRIQAIQGSVTSVDNDLRDEFEALTRRLSELEYVVRCRRPQTVSSDRGTSTIVLVVTFALCAYLIYTVAIPKVHDLGVHSAILDAARTIRDALS